jgi:hypothetical protein
VRSFYFFFFSQLLFSVPGVGIALRLLGEAGVLQENFGQVQALVTKCIAFGRHL